MVHMMRTAIAEVRNLVYFSRSAKYDMSDKNDQFSSFATKLHSAPLGVEVMSNLKTDGLGEVKKSDKSTGNILSK